MMNEWKMMYCIENHGRLKAGQQYMVQRISAYTVKVRCQGKIIYEDPRIFQMNKPIIKEKVEDIEDENY